MKGVAIFLMVAGLVMIGYFFVQPHPTPAHAQNRLIGMIVGGLLIARGVLSILARRK